MPTTIDFPSQLPTPKRDGYELNHVSPFARTEMANGRARNRRTFTSVPSMVPVSFLLTEPQAQIFQAWFKYEIGDGVDWFNCRLKTDVGLKDYECRFTGMYQGPRLIGRRHWRFTADLEIRERPVIDKDWYLYGLEYVSEPQIIDSAITREWSAA